MTLETSWAWFSASPARYWMVALPFAAAAAGLACRSRCRSWLYLGALGVAFAVFRWPIAVYGYELNADESQMIAAARTLMDHPVFWRSVDAHAAGPLCVYPLTILGWLGAPMDYLTARSFGYFMDWISIVGMFFLLRGVYGERLARIAVLVPFAYFCLVRFWAVSHFSTEAVPAALFAVGLAGLWLGIRLGTPRSAFLGALALGAIPWAKLQAVPIALVAGICAVAYLFRRWKSDLPMRRRVAIATAAGALAPNAFFAVVITVTGQWNEFLTAYIRSAQGYVAASSDAKSRVLAYFLSVDRIGYGAFALPLLVVVAVVLGTCLFHARRERALLGTLGLATLASFYAVLAPARPYAHYLVLTVVPLASFAAALVATLGEPGVVPGKLSSRPWFMPVALGLYLLCSIGTLIRHTADASVSPPYVFPPGTAKLFVDPTAQIVRRHAGPADSMTVWGWEPQIYVQTGLKQATREAHTERQIMPGPLQEFYRRRFLADLERNPPKVFVDAVGPGRGFYQDRRLQGHETWPDLKFFISTRYFFQSEQDGYRLYTRIAP